MIKQISQYLVYSQDAQTHPLTQNDDLNTIAKLTFLAKQFTTILNKNNFNWQLVLPDNDSGDFLLVKNDQKALLKIVQLPTIKNEQEHLIQQENPILRINPLHLQIRFEKPNFEKLIAEIKLAIAHAKVKPSSPKTPLRILLLTHVKNTWPWERNFQGQWTAHKGAMWKNINWDFLKAKNFDLVVFYNKFFFTNANTHQIESINDLVWWPNEKLK